MSYQKIGVMDCDSYLKMQEILSDEINDPEFFEFAIENLDELLSYIESGRVSIRIQRGITGEIRFGVGYN